MTTKKAAKTTVHRIDPALAALGRDAVDLVFRAKGYYSPELTVDEDGAPAGIAFQLKGTEIRKNARGEKRVVHYGVLLADCLGVIKGGETIQLYKGDTIGVSERAGYRMLRAYVGTDARIYIRALEKVELPDGRSAWRFDVKAIGEKAHRVVKPPVIGASADDPWTGDDSDDDPEELGF